MRIMGIDPGLASTGVGVIEEQGGGWRCIHSADVRTAAGEALPGRLKRIHGVVSEAIEAHRPDAIAIESLFVSKNVRSSVLMAHGRGVAILAAAASGIPIHEYSPLEIKQAVVGRGRAPKEQVMKMVKILLGMAEAPASEHRADSLACALTHAFRLKLRERTGPAADPEAGDEWNSAAKEYLRLAASGRRRRRRA